MLEPRRVPQPDSERRAVEQQVLRIRGDRDALASVGTAGEFARAARTGEESLFEHRAALPVEAGLEAMVAAEQPLAEVAHVGLELVAVAVVIAERLIIAAAQDP